MLEGVIDGTDLLLTDEDPQECLGQQQIYTKVDLSAIVGTVASSWSLKVHHRPAESGRDGGTFVLQLRPLGLEARAGPWVELATLIRTTIAVGARILVHVWIPGSL